MSRELTGRPMHLIFSGCLCKSLKMVYLTLKKEMKKKTLEENVVNNKRSIEIMSKRKR